MALVCPQVDLVFPEEETPFPHPLETRWGVPGKPGFAIALGFSLGSRLSLLSPSPPPLVVNRGSLVLLPTELPCSLHTKNGNPQAILGAVPSPLGLSSPAPTTLLDPPPSLVPSPAYPAAASGTPCGARGWEELTWAERSSTTGRLSAGWREGLGNVAWTQASRGSISRPAMYGLSQPFTNLGTSGWGPPGPGEDGVAMVSWSQ